MDKILELKQELYLLSSRATRILYPCADLSQIEVRLRDYIHAVTDLDDIEDDPYPDLDRVLSNMLSMSRDPSDGMEPDRYVDVLASASWKVYYTEKLAQSAGRSAACSSEGMAWALIVLASGEYRSDMWAMWHILPLVIMSVQQDGADPVLLRVIGRVAELLSYICIPGMWMDALVLHRCVEHQSGGVQDLGTLISGRSAYARDCSEVLLACCAENGAAEVAERYKDLLQAFSDEDVRSRIVEYIQRVCQPLKDYCTRKPQG